MSALEAEKHGLVSKVVPVNELVNEAVKLGEKISGMSKMAVAMAKQAVNAANNLPLDEGENLACILPILPYYCVCVCVCAFSTIYTTIHVVMDLRFSFISNERSSL